MKNIHLNLQIILIGLVAFVGFVVAGGVYLMTENKEKTY